MLLKIGDEFVLQLKQKNESMEADKERFGAAGKDRDSVRAAILEEAVIVCNFTLCLFIKKIKMKNLCQWH